MEISQMTASQIISAIKNRTLSSENLVEYNYKNIEKYNCKYNVLINIKNFDLAIKEAQLSDSRRAEGKALSEIDGVTFIIKDNIIDKDFFTTCASDNLSDYKSIEDASVVKFIKQAGGIIIGKSNLDQFGMGSFTENSVYGRTLNPLDETIVSGGSSGGSAVAVATNMTVFGIGSDTGGSIRQPAVYCGVCGFKPSYGIISRYGLISYASSLDTIGFISNDINSFKSVLEVCSEDDYFDSTHRGLDKIKIDKNKSQYSFATFSSISKFCDANVFQKFSNNLKKIKLFSTIEEVDIGSLESILASYYFLATAEASSNLGRYDGIRYGSKNDIQSDDFTEEIANARSNFIFETKKRIILGNFVLSGQFFEQYYTQSLNIRRSFCFIINKILEKYDAILLPATSTVPQKINEKINQTQVYKNDILTIIANMAGIPSVSFCSKKESDFACIQVLSKKYSDLQLLNMANQIEQMLNN